MLTTITIDEYGPKCLDDFLETMTKIKEDYDAYGNVVLEKRFKRDYEVFSRAFKSKKFEEEIKSLWKSRYHFVANTMQDIIKCYIDFKQISHSSNTLLLLPESNNYERKNESKGNEAIFAISEKLYNQLMNYKLEISSTYNTFEKSNLFIHYDNRLFAITHWRSSSSDSYNVSSVTEMPNFINNIKKE